jgi:integrase
MRDRVPHGVVVRALEQRQDEKSATTSKLRQTTLDKVKISTKKKILRQKHIKTEKNEKGKMRGMQGTMNRQLRTKKGMTDAPKTQRLEIQRRFAERTTQIVKLNRSGGWMRTVKRFLPVVSLAPKDRLPSLLKMKRNHGWCWNTVKTYHGAILAAMKILEIEKTVHDNEATAFLDRKAVEEISRVPSALKLEDAHKLLKMAKKEKKSARRNIMTAICFAFHYGQRISDILLLRREDITVREEGTNVVATIRRGKTVKSCKPFSLHVPKGTLGTLVKSWASKYPLFPRNAKRSILEILRRINPQYELRSIRRGGLQMLASSGIDPETLRSEFSKHRTVGMLNRYLEHGACLSSQRRLHHWAMKFSRNALKLERSRRRGQ